MKKLVLENCQVTICSFKAVLLDLIAFFNKEFLSAGSRIKNKIVAQSFINEKQKTVLKTLIYRLRSQAANKTPI